MPEAKAAVVFDLGGVLIEWQPREAYLEAFPGQGQLVERFLGGPFRELALRSCEDSRPLAEIAAPYLDRYPDYAPLLEFFASSWHRFVRGPMPRSVVLLERLAAAGVPLFGLTNWPRQTYPPRGESYRFLAHLREVVVSGDGLRKPGRAMFEHALARFALTPGQALYVDDRLENVAAAIELGMPTHHFRDADGLETFLHEHGLL